MNYTVFLLVSFHVYSRPPIFLILHFSPFRSHFLQISISIGRPTYEFPHPMARVPQSAGYWVCPLLKTYL